MLKAEDGATFETDLTETEAGWQASYNVISRNGDQVEPGRRVFTSKADAIAWLTAEATARGVVYEPPV